jgi:hypothetical protein
VSKRQHSRQKPDPQGCRWQRLTSIAAILVSLFIPVETYLLTHGGQQPRAEVSRPPLMLTAAAARYLCHPQGLFRPPPARPRSWPPLRSRRLPAVADDAPPGAARLNQMTVKTSRDVVTLPWQSRDDLLREIRHLDSAREIVAAFEAVGATRPVEISTADQSLLVQAIDVWMSNAGGPDALPPGIFALRNALLDELSH